MSDDAPILLRVRIAPKASQDRIIGWSEGFSGLLIVRVTAPPHAGQANAALIRLLADSLGIAKSHIEIKRGQRQRDKTLAIDISPEAYAQWTEAMPLIGKE